MRVHSVPSRHDPRAVTFRERARRAALWPAFLAVPLAFGIGAAFVCGASAATPAPPNATVTAAGVTVTVALPNNPSTLTVSVLDPDLATYNVALQGLRRSDPTYTYQLLAGAVAKAKRLNAGTLLLPPGTYMVKKPAGLPIGAGGFDLTGLNNITVQATGATIVFQDITQGVSISGATKRVLVQGLTIDYAPTLAYPGVLTSDAAGTPIFVVNNQPDYAIDPANPPVLTIVEEFDTTNKTYPNHPAVYNIRHVAGLSGQGVPPPTYNTAANAFYFDPSDIPTLTTALQNSGGAPIPGIGTVRQGLQALSVSGSSSQITLQNISIYSSPGMAILMNSSGRGFHLTGIKVVRNPNDPSRMISTLADGVNATVAGDIIVENSEFGYQEDDGINLHSPLYTVNSWTGKKINIATSDASDLLLGDQVRLVDATLATRLSSTITGINAACGNNNTCQLTLNNLTDAIPAGTSLYMIDLSQSSGNFIISSNYFHDNRAHGIEVHSIGGTIIGNTVANTNSNGIRLDVNLPYWQEGPGPQNVTVANNVVSNTSIGQSAPTLTYLSCYNTNWPSGYEAAIHLVGRVFNAPSGTGISYYGPLANITIQNNTVAASPGLAILVASADGVKVLSNRINGANVTPYQSGQPPVCSGPAARGSIFVSHARNVSLQGNLFSGPTTQGIAADSASTSNVVWR